MNLKRGLKFRFIVFGDFRTSRLGIIGMALCFWVLRLPYLQMDYYGLL